MSQQILACLKRKIPSRFRSRAASQQYVCMPHSSVSCLMISPCPLLSLSYWTHEEDEATGQSTVISWNLFKEIMTLIYHSQTSTTSMCFTGDEKCKLWIRKSRVLKYTPPVQSVKYDLNWLYRDIYQAIRWLILWYDKIFCHIKQRYFE